MHMAGHFADHGVEGVQIQEIEADQVTGAPLQDSINNASESETDADVLTPGEGADFCVPVLVKRNIIIDSCNINATRT